MFSDIQYSEELRFSFMQIAALDTFETVKPFRSPAAVTHVFVKQTVLYIGHFLKIQIIKDF